jgi:hypothetical protein
MERSSHDGVLLDRPCAFEPTDNAALTIPSDLSGTQWAGRLSIPRVLKPQEPISVTSPAGIIQGATAANCVPPRREAAQPGKAIFGAAPLGDPCG